MNEWVLLALAGLNLLVLVVVLLRSRASSEAQAHRITELLAEKTSQHTAWQLQQFTVAQAQTERLERELRAEISQSGVQGRQEAMHNLSLFQQSLLQQSAEATRTQNQQIDALAQQLALLQKSLTDSLAQQVNALSESNARRLTEMRGTMETQLAQLQLSNAAKLDEMRQTVDEKLQATLQSRLGESFKQVAERLEQVHKGLGEMQQLALGVGDLKHLLTNVKTRGMFGEAQLASLLEQVLTPDQYAVHYENARSFAQLVAQSCSCLPQAEKLFICTGGGPGIMEAANRGAQEGGALSVALNIALPHEQHPNPYVTPHLSFKFHYFALRKMHFMMRAKALVAFPGGFGTLDELFEVVTLVQTRKAKPVPILLFGTPYWKNLFNLQMLVDEGMISEDDLKLFQYVDTPEAAWQAICDFYQLKVS